MIVGAVSSDGVPTITVDVYGEERNAIVDTGFNGDLELPLELKGRVPARFIGRVISALAGGQSIEENVYLIEFLFDGASVQAEATFAPVDEVLIGTRLLTKHRVEVDFPERRLVLERILD